MNRTIYKLPINKKVTKRLIFWDTSFILDFYRLQVSCFEEETNNKCYTKILPVEVCYMVHYTVENIKRFNFEMSQKGCIDSQLHSAQYFLASPLGLGARDKKLVARRLFAIITRGS